MTHYQFAHNDKGSAYADDANPVAPEVEWLELEVSPLADRANSGAGSTRYARRFWTVTALAIVVAGCVAISIVAQG